MTKVISKLRKLLALAGSGETNEAVLAQLHAERIAAEHGIDLASLPMDVELSGDAVRVDVPMESNAMWRSSLGWAVAPYCHVQLLRQHGGKALIVIGLRADIETFRALFARAEQEIDEEAQRFLASIRGQWGVSARSEADTWRKGAAAGFGQRLREWAAQAGAGRHAELTAWDGNRGWMVMVGRDALVQRRTKEMFPKTRTVKTHVGGTRDSYSRGHAFGRSMGVHRANLS